MKSFFFFYFCSIVRSDLIVQSSAFSWPEIDLNSYLNFLNCRLIKPLDMEVLMVDFDPIERSLDYFTWPGQDSMDWSEPEDWEEDSREWVVRTVLFVF